jgi:hypothetical protein
MELPRYPFASTEPKEVYTSDHGNWAGSLRHTL